MQSSDVQKDIPDMIKIARQVIADLEAAAEADRKVDICESLRSAMRASMYLEALTSKAMLQAQKCAR